MITSIFKLCQLTHLLIEIIIQLKFIHSVASDLCNAMNHSMPGIPIHQGIYKQREICKQINTYIKFHVSIFNLTAGGKIRNNRAEGFINVQWPRICIDFVSILYIY